MEATRNLMKPTVILERFPDRYVQCGLLFFFKQKTAYDIMPSLVGSEMCIRDSNTCWVPFQMLQEAVSYTHLTLPTILRV